VAVKMESLDSDHPKLAQEWKVYKSLTSSPGIPRVFWFGTERGYKAMVMSLLGPSLEDLFTACNRTFSLKTVLKLAHCLVLDRFFFLFMSHSSSACRFHILSISTSITLSIVTSSPTIFLSGSIKTCTRFTSLILV
jgi:serine/threonine protein kinase